MRDDYRHLLRPTGVVPEIVYLDTPRDVALGRIRSRASEHPDDIVLPEILAAEYFDHFEAPTADEGPLTVVSYGNSGFPGTGTTGSSWPHTGTANRSSSSPTGEAH